MQVAVGDSKMNVRVLFTEKEIRDRVGTLAKQINLDFAKTDCLLVIVVLNGALLFSADLVRGLNIPTELESVRIRSYHGLQSTGKIELVSAFPANVAGRDVLVVEDIVDSGRSIQFLKAKLNDLGARSVKVATLLDKPSSHEVEANPDYIGFSIGPNFVIGYGLDLDGKYRNFPYVAELIKP